METSLHKQLKEVYAEQAAGDGSFQDSAATQEFRLGNYRVDVCRGNELVEIQHGSLASIRNKIKRLVDDYRVLVVKPLIAEKTIIRCATKGGRVVGRRMSPKRCNEIHFFEEFVYFVKVFPHPNLVIEVPFVEVEEWRYPGHGRRRRWRRDDFQIEDQKLVGIRRTVRIATCDDLFALLPKKLIQPYNTADIAKILSIHRSDAQRIAYCLRETGAAVEVGKVGNARLYRRAA